MACIHFVDGGQCRCMAVGGLFVPSRYERDRYCLGDKHALCPTHQARARRADPLPEEDCHALWLPVWDCTDERGVTNSTSP